MPHPPAPVTQVTIGVDTHADTHAATARDQLGRPLPTTSAGYAQLLSWAQSLGTPAAWGVEGTGSYGAGLARCLADQQQHVIEVNRPDRTARRHHGRSDPVDADAAARAVQAGDATSIPKAQTRLVEMLRSLRTTRQSAIKARTSAINQLNALLVTAPAELREHLQPLPTTQLLRAASALEPGPLTTPLAAAKLAVRSLAQRIAQLTEEADLLARQIDTLTTTAAPSLRARFGVGWESAAVLLIAAGDNPTRLTSDAATCGASPVDASSGKQQRHRRNRGGNRQANAALHRIVLARLRHHQLTRDDTQQRAAQGKTRREVIRCLKRYVARELFGLLAQVNHDTTPQRP